MKQIKSTVSYTVPSWNYCNIDRVDINGQVPKELCKFCIKLKESYRCLLYEKSLMSDRGLVDKTRDCCKATAGFTSNINSAPPQPTVDPKQIINYAINEYTKQVKDLRNQGYPQALAEQLARKYIIGG